MYKNVKKYLQFSTQMILLGQNIIVEWSNVAKEKFKKGDVKRRKRKGEKKPF